MPIISLGDYVSSDGGECGGGWGGVEGLGRAGERTIDDMQGT